MTLPIFTVNESSTKGATIDALALKGASTTIPAILVGEPGRGRQLGVVPVHLSKDHYNQWQERQQTTIYTASIGSTKANKPKLFEANDQKANFSKCIVIFRTRIGFRGGNQHTGDRINPQNPQEGFLEFPGKILAKGRIAQGAAGYMGGGQQLIAVIPRGTVFRTGYSGRLYGSPSAHYHYFDGNNILSATWEERVASDLF